jgi:hypothetical protein
MAGLVPAIHVVPRSMKQDVDARDKRGHDGLSNRRPVIDAMRAWWN